MAARRRECENSSYVRHIVLCCCCVCVCVWLQNGHSNSEGFFGVSTQLGNGTMSSLPEHLLLVVLRFLGCPSPSPSLLPLFSLHSLYTRNSLHFSAKLSLHLSYTSFFARFKATTEKMKIRTFTFWTDSKPKKIISAQRHPPRHAPTRQYNQTNRQPLIVFN